ncbi:ABC transporter ATP-binding protein [Peptacetobacter sp.]|uniref:ABC transporter ATP-binding protein n=1 Tax=Peptacetobacter sp. TaxID=2991975 RepID=UPI003AB35A7C
MIEIKNLSLTLDGNNTIFKDISFSVDKNKVTLISGKSGSGKSSLLMRIMGFFYDSEDSEVKGEILLDGQNILGEKSINLAGKIGYLFQDPDSQLCTFTVEDEIAFGLENLNRERKYIENKIDEVLKLLNIEFLKFRDLNTLSGGEKQKVALASILAMDPELILLDEPTANLDPKSTKEILNVIEYLKEKEHKTILIIEHKVQEFKDIIDDVIIFDSNSASKVKKDSFLEKYMSDYELPKHIENKTGSNILEVKNLYFSYNDKDVLKNINLNLKSGEILGIAGYNGAGKTTFTKVLIGFNKPKKGSIYIDGLDIKSMSKIKLGEYLGLVFQNPEHQFIKLRVEDELRLSLNIKTKDELYVKSKIDEYLEMFDLLQNRKDNPFLLSQGQKRRLSTACMMINNQKILILDEPTYGQDIENLKKLVNLLYKINEKGVSIIIITHDMQLLSKSCDRVIYLEKGEINFEGKADEFVRKGIF